VIVAHPETVLGDQPRRGGQDALTVLLGVPTERSATWTITATRSLPS
jgi:hypothetical protein